MFIRYMLCALPVLALAALPACQKLPDPSYHLDPGTATPYQVEVAQRQHFEAQDRPSADTRIRMSGLMHLVVDREGSAATSGVQLVMPRLHVELAEQPAPTVPGGVPAREDISFRLDSLGNLSDFRMKGEPEDRNKLFLANLEQTLREVLPALPGGPLKPGDEWNRSFAVRSTTPPMDYTTLFTDARYRVKELRQDDSLVAITVNFLYRMGDERGEPARSSRTPGHQVTVQGIGTGGGLILLDRKARRLHRADITNRLEMTVLLEQGGKSQQLKQQVTSHLVVVVGDTPRLARPEMP